MKQVGLYEAKSKLSALVSALIESGDPVSLTKHGQVVAELRLPSSITPSRGSMAAEDFSIAPDFDQPTGNFQRGGQDHPPEETGR